MVDSMEQALERRKAVLPIEFQQALEYFSYKYEKISPEKLMSLLESAKKLADNLKNPHEIDKWFSIHNKGLVEQEIIKYFGNGSFTREEIFLAVNMAIASIDYGYQP